MEGASKASGSATVLRHLKRSERTAFERNPFIFVLAWLAFFGTFLGIQAFDIIRHSKSAHPLAFADRQLLGLSVVIPIVLWATYKQYKDGFAAERRYLEITDDAIALKEQSLKPSVFKPRVIWSVKHADLDKVVIRPISKGSQSMFVLAKKPDGPWKRWKRIIGIGEWGPRLRAGDWVIDDGSKRRNPASPWGVFRLTSRNKLMAEMLETDLGKALELHGYLRS